MNLAKRVMYGFAGVVFLSFLAILALHHDGSIETGTLIDSSPQAVWAVLTATDDYPLWNPEISRLRGQLREGNVIEFVEGTGPDAMVFHPKILAVQALRELRWKGCFTFEPHISQHGGRWGFKHENIYYFDNSGAVMEL